MSYTSHIKRVSSCDFQITWGGQILKENCLLLQYTSISSYTIDARITKPIYAWYPYAYRWWQRIWNFPTSSSFEKIQILVILPKNAISLGIYHEIISNSLGVWGGCHIHHNFISNGFYHVTFRSPPPPPPPANGNIDGGGGGDFERNLFVTSVYQYLLLHYWC